MKNALFDIKFDKDTGCITEIVNPLDQNKMNWCSDLIGWGKIKTLKNEVNLIEFKEFDKQKNSIFDLKDKKTVSFKIDGKGYSIPSVDCVFLPLPYTSAEELSKFFAETLAKKLSEDYDNLEYVSICVNEGIGQGAVYRKDIK